jgi:hypothetical protein
MVEEHAVVIADAGPTGMMLAAELALARGGRRPRRATHDSRSRKLARARSARAHHRTARSARRRRAIPLERTAHAGCGLRRDTPRHQRLSAIDSSASPRATTTASRSCKATSSASSPVAAPATVLIRPDGYVAWVGDGTDQGLLEALTYTRRRDLYSVPTDSAQARARSREPRRSAPSRG